MFRNSFISAFASFSLDILAEDMIKHPENYSFTDPVLSQDFMKDENGFVLSDVKRLSKAQTPQEAAALAQGLISFDNLNGDPNASISDLISRVAYARNQTPSEIVRQVEMFGYDSTPLRPASAETPTDTPTETQIDFSKDS